MREASLVRIRLMLCDQRFDSALRRSTSGTQPIAQSRSLPFRYVFRAKLILMLAEGASYHSIKLRMGTTAPTISL